MKFNENYDRILNEIHKADFLKDQKGKIPKLEKEIVELEKKIKEAEGNAKKDLEKKLSDKKDDLSVIKGYVKDKYDNPSQR